ADSGQLHPTRRPGCGGCQPTGADARQRPSPGNRQTRRLTIANPGEGSTVMTDRAALLHAGLGYAADGLAVFFLGRSKRPVANCGPCRAAGSDHDPEVCACLTCHGFYAATCDSHRIVAMHTAVRGGLLAIRTGAASGVVVIDIDLGHGGR